MTEESVVHAPFQRAQLGNMAEEIRTVVYRYANRASVAEVLGVLEIVKQEIYRSSMEVE
jgi:hypothetical protein